VVIYLPLLNSTELRIVLTLPLVFFIPGYCLIATLFPKKSDIDLIERVALSFGLSIAVVTLIGLGLNFTPLGIRLYPLVISLTLFSWVMILAAYYRRARLPSEKRFTIPFSTISKNIRHALLNDQETRVNQLLNVILLIVAIIAIITTFSVIVFPQEGERYTEFFLLGETRTATDYPTQILAGNTVPSYIGVGNHEYQSLTYTIETWAMLSEFDNRTNTSTILVMDPLDHASLVLAHNETQIIPYSMLIQKTGYNRVEFLLFNETVPGPDVKGSDRINASYRNLHLWITVR